MESAEIHRRFLAYFQARGHTVVPSASLVADDPTLLLVNAGMVPFKPYFTGAEDAPYPRATSVQKCVRTVDIEVVGTTTRHMSFFQMAGNFSFGDYFKEQAIPFAWELLTAPVDGGGFGFDPDRLWATVFRDDDEAADIWTRVVGLPADRVQRRGVEDNYWHMGVPGPGGPCSEIYFDRGPEHGRDGGPVADEERYLEVWNLVFMQHQLGAVRSKVDFDILGDLPRRNIDTGMGLERMATLLQGVDSVYETDLLRPVLDRAAELTGARYGDKPEQDVRLRVVADHTRTVAMLVGDGVTPSNEGRGYVLRRMIRRVVRTLRLLGANEPVLGEMVATARDRMGTVYPELRAQADRIDATVRAEEESFLATLRTGTALFDSAVADTRAAGGRTLSGERAFTLHDTYGFPIELTLEMAAEQGLAVDEQGFRALMAEQRSRAKADAAARKTGHVEVSAYRELLAGAGDSEFTGYTEVRTETEVSGLLVAGEVAAAAGPGDEVEVVLRRTPFYAEGGGQLADRGFLTVGDGVRVEVLDVQRPLPGLIVHRARVLDGEIRRGVGALAEVDIDRRRAISRSHTATHLVHRAIRAVLGEQAAQAGSENAPGRLRFDFTAPGAVSPGLLADVEDEINAVALSDLPVRAFITSQQEARRLGALALFGEKYGDQVRVVEVGDYARELCGGTHVARSGQLGVIKLLRESSIGAGVRRVEGLVGLDAFRYLAREHVLVAQLAETLKARPEELAERVAGTLARLRDAERELDRLRAQAVLAAAPQVAASAADEFGVAVVTHRLPDGTPADDVRRFALDVRGRLDSGRPGVAAAAAVTGGRPVLVVAVNDTARSWGLSAGTLVRAGTAVLGGGGGGRDDVAQGGGSRAEAVDDALLAVRHRVGETVTASP